MNLDKALIACGAAATCYTDLVAAFRLHVAPILNTLLHTALSEVHSERSLAASVSEDLCAVALQLAAHPDTWYLAVSTTWEVLQQLRHHTTERSQKEGDGDDEAPSTTAISVTTSVAVNCAVFLNLVSTEVLCEPSVQGKRQVNEAQPLPLLWPFLASEADSVEHSAMFVSATTSERRTLRRSTVLGLLSHAQRRALYTRCWAEVLSYPTHDAEVDTQMLAMVTTDVLPHLTNPLLLSDWFLRKFAAGGVVAVLALRGLFTLMVDHGLEQPRFFHRLYDLITPETFASRHRAELFRLLDACMSSVRLPSTLVAAFVKRIMRAVLLAPSPTLYFVLPVVRRLLQAHPAVQTLIHREGGESGVDPFDPSAPPDKFGAEASSLYEIEFAAAHFLPACSPMVNALAVPAVDRAPLKYSKTYGRLFTAAATRRGAAEVAPRVPVFEVLRSGVLRL